jgi:hypothetical protein
MRVGPSWSSCSLYTGHPYLEPKQVHQAFLDRHQPDTSISITEHKPRSERWCIEGRATYTFATEFHHCIQERLDVETVLLFVKTVHKYLALVQAWIAP